MDSDTNVLKNELTEQVQNGNLIESEKLVKSLGRKLSMKEWVTIFDKQNDDHRFDEAEITHNLYPEYVKLVK